MTTLSEYRASMRRVLEAENMEDAVVAEGYGVKTAALMAESKSHLAVRSITCSKKTPQ